MGTWFERPRLEAWVVGSSPDQIVLVDASCKAEHKEESACIIKLGAYSFTRNSRNMKKWLNYTLLNTLN